MTDKVQLTTKVRFSRKSLLWRRKWLLAACAMFCAIGIIGLAQQVPQPQRKPRPPQFPDGINIINNPDGIQINEVRYPSGLQQIPRLPQFPECPRKESRFTFGRIYYDDTAASLMRYTGPVGANNGPPWSHDWPRAEEHFMKIMAEVTKLDVNPCGHITSFQSDDCFKYPIAYLCEVGYLDLSKEEARRMAEYLLRGGFLIVDDFRGEQHFNNFKRQMKQVFPDRSLEEIPRTHQIWTCFYDISRLNILPPYSRNLTPQYFGINDDNGRLMMVANYNNDISEYWEWSNDPTIPIDESNEAYKYGVNYVMYALTH